MSSNEPMDPEDIRLVYSAVASRRLQWDSLLWQVPVLSLTAQAFLYATVFGPDSSTFGRLASAALSIVITLMSITLMARHRQAEITDARWLESVELRWPGEYRQHGRPWRARRNEEAVDAGWLDKVVPTWPAYKVWTVGLGCFGLISVAAIIAALVQPSLFS